MVEIHVKNVGTRARKGVGGGVYGLKKKLEVNFITS